MGGVLLSYDFSKTAKAITNKTGLDGQKVIKDLYTNYIDQWNDFELGTVSPEDFFALFHLPMSFDDLKKAYNEIFTLKKDTFRLVKTLKAKGMRLGVLSNTSQPHWEYVQSTFPELFSQFDVLSIDAGLSGDCVGGFAKIVAEQNAAHVEVYEFDHFKGVGSGE